MQYQELILNKLEILEGKLKTMIQLAQQGNDIQAYHHVIEESQNLIDDIKSFVSREN